MRCCLESCRCCSSLAHRTGEDSDNSQASVVQQWAPPPSNRDQQQDERNQSTVVLIKFIHGHCNEVNSFLNTFLKPLIQQSPSILDEDDVALLTSVKSILDEHCHIKSAIANSLVVLTTRNHQQSYSTGHAGALFLQAAPRIQSCLEQYASVHPCLIRLMNIKSKEIYALMTKYQGGEGSETFPIAQLQSPSKNSTRFAAQFIICVNRHLSSPFRAIAKYPLLLRDLERTYEEHHPDRGDIQRAIQYYKDMSPHIEDTRRRKELEIEVLSAPVAGWDREQQKGSGCPLAVANVLWESYTTAGNEERKHSQQSMVERITLLYPYVLVCFSYDCPQNRYKFESEHPLSKMVVTDSQDHNRLIELSGTVLKRFFLTFSSSVDYMNWKSLLARYTHQPEPPIEQSSLPISKNRGIRPFRTCAPLHKPTQLAWTPSHFRRNIISKKPKTGQRGCVAPDIIASNSVMDEVSKRLQNCESDAMILSLIESYYNVGYERFQESIDAAETETILGFMMTQQQQNAAKKKSFVSSSPSFSSGVGRSHDLHLAIRRLNQQMTQFRAALKNLKRDLEEERKARVRLEHNYGDPDIITASQTG
ncbi:hypothetical protein ACOME3_009860 [Neoechinorhynchus agilis]